MKQSSAWMVSFAVEWYVCNGEIAR